MKARQKIYLAVLAGAVIAAGAWLGGRAFDRADSGTFLSRVGVPLPATASNLQALDSHGFDGGEYWASADLPAADFLAVAQAAGMQADPPVLQQYPDAFMRRPDAPEWWPTAVVSHEKRYFGTRSDGYLAAEYLNGRIYLRKSTY